MNNDASPIKPPKKIELFLQLMINNPQGVTQPDAYAAYRDSCLNTMVSNLQRTHGIKIDRATDHSTVRHFGNHPFTRYWLANDIERQKSVDLLSHYRKRRIRESGQPQERA